MSTNKKDFSNKNFHKEKETKNKSSKKTNFMLVKNYPKKTQQHPTNYKPKKITNQDILSETAFKSTRDAEWFKRTISKIEEVKKELDDKFLTEEKKEGKKDFIRILQTKIKDYREAKQSFEIYKKIRFFERRKLERELKQINKKLLESEEKTQEEKNNLETRKEEVEDKINYVKVSEEISLEFFIFSIILPHISTSPYFLKMMLTIQ